jgi:D-sedoheptulose 7-phosphate isomerase
MTHFPTNPRLAPCLSTMTEGLALLRRSVLNGGKVLVCGNGGSASDSEHIVGELMKGFNLKRPLSPQQTAALEAANPGEGALLASKLQGTIAAVSLVSQTGLITAIANDTDADMIFAQQVLGIGRRGDVLLALSTSGNSRNVVAAAKVARAFGLKVLALTGEGGGRLAPLADVAIRVPATHVAEIQELHLPVYHWLCAQLEDDLFGDKPMSGGLPDPIGLIVFDFDGVFTDNKVYTAQDGTELVACDRADGLGLDSLRALGVPMMILSTETNPVVAARARKLKLPVEQSCGDKAAWLADHLATKGIDPATVIYVGNDLNDLAAMGLVGYTVAPADAHPDIRNIASLVLTREGGRGAVRELSDFISRQAKV